MYDSNETPSVSSILYYYDDCIDDKEALAANFLSLIQESVFSFNKIEVRKNILISGINKTKTIRYPSKDIREMNLAHSLNEWIWDSDTILISLVNSSRNSYFRIDWSVGFALPGIGKSKMSETLHMSCTYDRIADRPEHDGFVGLFCNMASLLNAFYGKIDDVAASVDTMDRTKETCFTEEYLQAVYWGNFFGKKICEDIGMKALTSLPVECKRAVGEGFFFSLTPNIQDSISPNMRKRRRIYRRLKPSKRNALTDYSR